MLARHQLAAAAAVLILLAPTAVYAVDTEVTTGHINYVDMEGLDPCLAAIAGLARLRVMWFDDSILHERDTFNDGNYIYAIEHGAPAPVDRPLVYVRNYTFQDPNMVWWNVSEAYFDVDPDGKVRHEGFDEVGTDGLATDKNVSYDANTTRYYTWIVEIGPTTFDDHAGAHDHTRYNFVTMVNTCKFNDWVENGTRNDTGNESGHLPSDGNHTHETYKVDLYSDSAPTLIPLGAAPPHEADGYQRVGAGGDHDEDHNVE